MGNIRRISRKYYLRKIVACWLVCYMLLGIPASITLADIGTGGHTVVRGSAIVNAPGGGADAYINMTSDRAVINWQDFDTGTGQLAEFVRTAGGNFAVLNRVIAGGATQFYGNIEAFAGDVFIVNTRGIVFGPDSYIQARNFAASGIDIRNDAFMNSIYQFQRGVENPYGNVIGDVETLAGGRIEAENISLIGKNVLSKGTITAPGGAIVMAAGESVYLSEVGSNVTVQVAMTNPADHIVDNDATIDATAGKVILAAGDIYSTAISGIESLRAEAKKDITLEDTITTTGDITLVADGDVDIDLGIQSGGDFTSSGVDFDNTGGDIDTSGGGGAIVINHTGTVTLGADLNPGGGSITGTATSIEVASNDAEIQDAIDVAHVADGADITVSADTYTENLSVDKPDITLQSKDTDTVTLAPTSGDIISVTAGGDSFILGGASDQGFTVDTTNGASKGVSAGGTTGLTVSHNIFTADNDDTSIEAQDVVDLLITNNRFTGSSAVGLDLAGVTGSSSVQSNVIDNYDVGIKVSNGTGTDGLSISGNDILNNTTGILFSQSGTGNTENVSVEYNMLTDNTTGLKVEDGGHVLAETFTIQYNGFEGGTTGLANENTLYEVTAEKNWWGHATGPGPIGSGSGVAITEAVPDTVDYTPWLGIGDADGGTIGFQVASPMIWWTDDSIQEAIDAASTVVPERVVAIAGTYDESVNVNRQLAGLSFAGSGVDSEITGTLTLSNDDADWDGGTLTVDTVLLNLIDPSNKNLTLHAVEDPDPGYHSLTLNTGTPATGGTTYLQGPVTVGKDLTLMSNAESDGPMTLDAGDSIFARGTLTTTSGEEVEVGHINLYASDSTIHLYGDVTADLTDGGDIFVHNRSEVSDGVTLKAGRNITIEALMTADGDLTLEAGDLTSGTIDGQIQAVGIQMPQRTTTPPTPPDSHTLTLKQTVSLDMEAALADVINSDNADLFAQSTKGSVTSAKADKWLSIAATAETFIRLDDSDTGGDIRTDGLLAITGDILIKSDLGKVYANGSLNADRDVKITAKNEGANLSDDSILLNYVDPGIDPEVEAGGDIWLNNNTLAADGVNLKAGQDVRVGWQGDQDPWDPVHGHYDPKTLKGKGALTVEADRHITLGGDVEASTVSGGNLILKADAGTTPPGLGVGNMTAYGTITNLGGTIDIYSSDTTTYLWDDVTASGDIILHNDTEVKASGKTLQSTGDDVVLAGGKTLDSDYDLTILAGDDIILGITDTANTEGSQTTGSAGNVTADGHLVLNAGDDVYAHGTLTTTDGSGGDIDIRSSNTTTYLWGDVTADQTTGGSILLHNTTWAADGVTLDAGQDVIVGNGGADGTALTGEGTLTVEADRHITLGGAVVASDTTSGDLVLWADKDGLGVPGGNMTAYGTIDNLGGSIDIYSSDNTTYLHDDVTASVDITLHNDTEVWADKTLDAGHDVVLYDGKTLDGQGNLTVRADHDITLGGATGTVGNLNLYADDNTDNDGDLLAKQAVTSGNYLDAYGNNITFEGPVSSTAGMYLWADSTWDGSGDLLAKQTVTSGGYLTARGNNITFEGPASSATYMYLQADSTNDGSGDLVTNSLTSGSYLEAYGNNITIGALAQSGTSMYLKADSADDGTGDLVTQGLTSGSYLYAYGDNVTIEGPASSGTYMYLRADSTNNGTGDLVTNSLTSGTWLEAYGNNITIGALAQSGTSMYLLADSTYDGEGDLLAKQTVTSGSWLEACGDDITFEGPVSSTGYMYLEADSKPDGSGDLLAKQAVTSGDYLYAYGDDITFEGPASSGTYMYLQADSIGDGSGDLVTQALTSGTSLQAYGNNITIGALAQSGTSMYLQADSTDDGTGDLVTQGLTSGARLQAYGNNITINGAVESGTDAGAADKYMWLQADSTNNGSGDLLAKQAVTSGDYLYAYGDNITFEGPVGSATRMYLRADSTYDGEGDLWAQNTISSGGWLEAYGDDITFEGPVSSATYMYLEADSKPDGSGDLTTQGLTSGTDLDAYGNNITIGALAQSGGNMYLYADSTDNGSGDLTTQALTSGARLQAYGDNITINGAAESGTDAFAADKYMELQADSTNDGSGDLLAKDSVTSGSWLKAYGDDITFEGPVSSATYMRLTADSKPDGSGDLLAKQTVTSGSTLEAYGNNITFEGPASSGSWMWLQADSTGDGTGSVDVHGLDAGGDIDILAADNTINIHKSADLLATADVRSDEDIRLWDDTVADDGVIIDAGVDVTVGDGTADGTTLTGEGALTVQADRHITLGGLVEAGTQVAGDLILAADAEGDNVGNMTAHGDVINGNGNIIISSADLTTFLNGDEVRASGNVNLQNNTVAADGILIKATQGDVVVGVETETVNPADYPGMPGLLPGVYTDTSLKGNGALTVEAGSDIIVGGDLTTGETTAGAMTLTAGDNISVKNATSKLGTTDIRGNMVMTATNGDIAIGNLKRDYDLHTGGDLVFEGGDLRVNTNARGDMTLTAENGDISFKNARAYGKYIGGGQYQGGNMNMTAGGDIAAGVIAPAIRVSGDLLDEAVVISQGGYMKAYQDMTLLAGNDIKGGKWTYCYGELSMVAGHDILIGGVVPSVRAPIYDTDGRWVNTETFGHNQDQVLDVYKQGYLDVSDGINLLAGNDIKAHAAFSDGDIEMTAVNGDILIGGLNPVVVEVAPDVYELREFDKGGRLEADGAVTLTAGRDISLKMARAEDDITMTAVENITLRSNLPGPSWDEPTDRTESYEGDIRLHALNGDISIVEGYKLIGGEFYDEEGVYGGGVSLIADNGKIYSPGGDNDTLNITIEGSSSQLDDIGVELPLDPDKKAAIVIISKEDLKLGPDSALLADGDYIPLHVINLDGITSLEQLDSYWEALAAEYGDVIEGLFDGFEDYLEDLGYIDMDLEDFDFSLLKGLIGDYLGSLDDRPAVGFLDVPATIGGVPRDEGAPIDVAVYLASTEGDVEVQMYIEVDIWAGEGVEIGEPEPSIYVERGGTIVVDAYDTVTFGDSGLKINLIDVDIYDIVDLEQMFDDLSDALLNQYGIEVDTADFLDAVEAYFVALGYTSPEDAFADPAFIDHLENFLGDYLEDQLAEDGRFIDRLEVCSRITEWLFQASLYGTLPYPYNPEIVEAFIGGDYILRGAGLGNINITDGRAWVLVDPVPPAPIYTEAGEAAEEEEFAEGGCPPLMEWLAIEIGVPAEDIQVALAGALALNTDIQPCEMCARLMDASKNLEDVEGTRIAAMARVVNEFVTTPAPPSPEQMTLIAAALAEHVGDGTHYAAAEQWLDSLVAYVGIMNTEMGYSASDAAAFAQKYLTPVTELGNVTLTDYVQARLAALGG